MLFQAENGFFHSGMLFFSSENVSNGRCCRSVAFAREPQIVSAAASVMAVVAASGVRLPANISRESSYTCPLMGPLIARSLLVEVIMSSEFSMHVFVYGTLRRGGANDINRLDPAPKWVGLSQVPGRLFSLGDYPAIELGAWGIVVGEVYAISPELEEVLDRIEGISPSPDGQYRKDWVSVAMGPQSLTCLIYVGTPETFAHATPMATGDWMS